MSRQSVALLLSLSVAACTQNAGTDAGADSGLAPDAGILGDAGADAGPDGSVDSGFDAGPTYCAILSEVCGSGQPCCGNLACTGGVCVAGLAPKCAGYFQGCSPSIPCCGTPNFPDAGLPVGPTCQQTNDAGEGVCLIGVQPGDSCGPGVEGCYFGLGSDLVCQAGSCVQPVAPALCPPIGGNGTCVLGSDCKYDIVMLNRDACAGSGYICLAGGLDSDGGGAYTCQQPMVVPPPLFPADLSIGGDFSSCLPGLGVCYPNLGDPAPVGCVPHFSVFVGPDSICADLCVTADDCPSLALDCIDAGTGVGGACEPHYCYVGDPDGGNQNATLLTNDYGFPVSNDANVLFQPCASAPNTTCLPQYDNYLNVTGICYRTGGADAGGVGASCDSSDNVRVANPGALCQTGTLCNKGTCLQWCDIGNKFREPCPTGESCYPWLGAALGSTQTATSNATGVCIVPCDPYVDATQNSCPAALVSPDGGAAVGPRLVCKLSGADQDYLPSPGICLAGASNPVPVGQACNAHGWQDPCVSGAECVEVAGDAGPHFVCAQVCDPLPSGNVHPPGCADNKYCRASPQCGVPACAHRGYCL